MNNLSVVTKKKRHLSDISSLIKDFMYHVHNAVFSRKAIKEGKAYCYYYSKNIKTMNDRKSVNKRMKHKLKILRNIRYNSNRDYINSFKKI